MIGTSFKVLFLGLLAGGNGQSHTQHDISYHSTQLPRGGRPPTLYHAGHVAGQQQSLLAAPGTSQHGSVAVVVFVDYILSEVAGGLGGGDAAFKETLSG